jgi:hypothetical protein
MRATARAASVTFVLLLLLLLTDRFLRPADLPMVLLSVVMLLLAGTVAVRVFWPLRRSPSDRQVARFIEERCPALEDRIASATDLADQEGRSAFRDLVFGDAAQRARDVDLDLVVPRSEVRRSIAAGFGSTVALVIILILGLGPFGRIARTAWLYAFPYTAQLLVEPGDVRVVAGESLRVWASLEGDVGAVTMTRSAPVLTMTAEDGGEQSVVMTAVDGGGYVLELDNVEGSFAYRVRAASLVSDPYDVTALFPPEIEQIDVAYEFPSSTGLAPRLEEDGGDVYAPIGTRVSVAVRVTKPVSQGALTLGDGRRVDLRLEDGGLEGSFDMVGDDTYRVSVIDRDGLGNTGDMDYFIRTMRDRPPTVEIVRPAQDRQITSLEEVGIEVRAADDFGLEQVELVYDVVGRPERVVDLRGETRVAELSATHTIYAETLGLQPGDFISYYARVRDTGAGRSVREIRSDIYFLEVRPFNREFEEAQSQGSGGMQNGDLGRLAEVQKEIVVATWKLDGQPVTDRRPNDVETVADAQGELRLTAQMLSARMRRPASEAGPDPRGGEADAPDALGRAVAAMGEAERALRDQRTDLAVPSEMRALTELLKAQAEAGRTQVTQSESQGGQGGGPGAQEDLSALFDEDLKRDQQTSYENRGSASATEDDQEESDVDRRLRELAERQQTLTEEQRDLASREAQLDASAVKRQLERLTREQEELREQMEELQRELGRQGRSASSSPADGDPSRRAGEQMREALSELRRGELSDAADRSQDALESLRELEREVGSGREARQAQALGELRLEAQQIAESQAGLANETRRLGPPGNGSTQRRLAEQERQLADRVDALTERLKELQPEVTDDERGALSRAEEQLQSEDVAPQMRDLAEMLQRAGESAASGAQEAAAPEAPGQRDDSDQMDQPDQRDEREGQDSMEEDERAGMSAELMERPARLADVMNQVATALARGTQDGDAADQMSQELESARALAERLEQIEQRLDEMASQGNEAASDPGSEADGEALAGLPGDLSRRLSESPELLDELRRARPSLEQDLERWAQHWQSGAAPGNQTVKRDLSEWATLYREVRLALEEFEASRSRELAEETRRERFRVGPTQTAPDPYRQLVDEYYRSLAVGSRSR